MEKEGEREEVLYRFTRVKDRHWDNGHQYITLFGRLAIERLSGTQSVWVELQEVAWADASPKLRAMPNCCRIYYINEDVFNELCRVSERCHQELFYITPSIIRMNGNCWSELRAIG